MSIDWDGLAANLGSISHGSDRLAQRAIAEILGKELIIDAVEHYLTGSSGSELCRSVLSILRPEVGMNYCYELYREDTDPQRRRSAVELLPAISDERVLQWVPEFLNDSDPDVQTWGAGIIDQLMFSNFISKDGATEILSVMERHSNPGVRRYRNLIAECQSDC
jgi:hypothetical protein